MVNVAPITRSANGTNGRTARRGSGSPKRGRAHRRPMLAALARGGETRRADVCSTGAGPPAAAGPTWAGRAVGGEPAGACQSRVFRSPTAFVAWLTMASVVSFITRADSSKMPRVWSATAASCCWASRTWIWVAS